MFKIRLMLFVASALALGSGTAVAAYPYIFAQTVAGAPATALIKCDALGNYVMSINLINYASGGAPVVAWPHEHKNSATVASSCVNVINSFQTILNTEVSVGANGTWLVVTEAVQ